MQDGEGDERVAALLVAHRELVGGCTRGREREVADETGDERTDALHDRAGEKGLGKERQR